MLTPRTVVLLFAVAVDLAGLRAGVAPAQTPSAAAGGDTLGLVVDSGALARARLLNGEVITGRLLAPFAPWSLELVVCDTAQSTSCATPDARGVRRLPMAELRSVAVRDRQGGNGAIFGLYIGMLTGAIAYHDESGGSMGAGGIIGVIVGHFIGSRVTGWVPLFPCGPHGQCGWRGRPLTTPP